MKLALLLILVVALTLLSYYGGDEQRPATDRTA
jgi:hypothetical protein